LRLVKKELVKKER